MELLHVPCARRLFEMLSNSSSILSQQSALLRIARIEEIGSSISSKVDLLTGKRYESKKTPMKFPRVACQEGE